MSHRTHVRVMALLVFAAIAGTTGAQEDSAPPAQTTPKKVWTNDDMGGLRDQPTILTGTAPDSKPNPAGATPAAGRRDAKWYHDRIAKLQAQLPPLDSQITALQDAINGKPTGDGKQSARPRSVKADDWSVELAQLQKKRDGIAQRINALEAEARQHGIPENALP